MPKRKVIVIDGQGGRLGAMIIAGLKGQDRPFEVFGLGTNSVATMAMLKAGADHSATGENAIVANSRNADVIVGPIGIVIADSLVGEITPAMAVAVGQCAAAKVLLPVNRCNHFVVGLSDMPVSELISRAVAQTLLLADEG